MANHFTSDIRPETYPLCGFDGNWNGKEGNLYNSRVVTDEPSPDGKPFLRTEYVADCPITGDNTQYDIGVGNLGLHTPVTQGMEIFLRWSVRVRNHYPGGRDNPGIFVSSSKLVMVGNAAGNEGISRIISEFRDDGTTFESSSVGLMVNINGGPRVNVADQEWNTFQAAIKSGSSENAPDGRLRLWVNNMDENSPAIDTRDIQISTVAWEGGWVRYGGFLGFEGTERVWSPAPIIDLGSFELGDSFDSAWGTGQVTEPPVEPPPVEPPTEPPSGTIPVPIGTPFVMKQNQVYSLPNKKQCTIYCDSSAALEQSNDSAFNSCKPVALVNGQADLNGSYIRNVSGDVEALVKVS